MPFIYRKRLFFCTQACKERREPTVKKEMSQFKYNAALCVNYISSEFILHGYFLKVVAHHCLYICDTEEFQSDVRLNCNNVSIICDPRVLNISCMITKSRQRFPNKPRIFLLIGCSLTSFTEEKMKTYTPKLPSSQCTGSS